MKKILLGLFLLSLALSAFTQIPAYLPETGLIGWWPFDGNANDESGNGYDGTPFGATLTSDRFGVMNAAYNFNGTSDYVDLPNDINGIAGSVEFSVSLWFKTNQNSSTPQGLFTYWHMTNSPIGEPIGFYVTAMNSKIYTNYVSGLGVGTISNISENSWHHLVIVYNGNISDPSMRQVVYMDNIVIQNDFACAGCNTIIPEALGNLGTYFRLGARPDEFLNGSLDDVGIWNHALSTQEVNSLYTQTTECLPSYVPVDGLIGFWPFCESAEDVSGNGHNGTVNGSTWATDRFGVPSHAASFQNDIAQSISADIGIQDTLSFSLWYSCASQSSYYPTLLDYGNSTIAAPPITRYLMHIAGEEPSWIGNFTGHAYIQTNVGGDGYIEDTGITTDNQWHHMVCVFVPNDSAYLYVDGLLVGQDGLSNTEVYTGSFFMGRDANDNAGECSGCGRYEGFLDDVGVWGRALSPQEISSLYLGTIITTECLPDYVPTDNLMGYWPFCGNANDESGNGYNGTVNGATLTSDRFGNSDAAYQFDGIGNFIEATNINLPDSGTISVWVNPYLQAAGNNSITYSASLVDMNIDANGNSSYGLYYNDSIGTGLYGQVGWSGDPNNMVIPTTAQNLNLFDWQHCVFTFNNGVGKLYWNGNLIYTQTGLNPTSQSSQPVLFGKGPWASNANLFMGKLDDIGIWSRALTDQEIQDLYLGDACTLEAYISAQGPTNFCQDQSVELSANTGPDFEFQWYLNNSVIEGATDSLYEAGESGIYTVEISDGSGCIAMSEEVMVTVYSNPTAPVISFLDISTACEGESVVLISDISDANGFQWNLNDTGISGGEIDSYSAMESGNYTLTIFNEYECSATSNQIEAIIIPIPLPIISPMVNSLLVGESAVFTVSDANGASEFNWQTNPSNAGWMILPDNATYSGGSSSQITINLVGLANHLQPFIVSASNGDCTGTSEEAIIAILDTCITEITVYDTVHISVTDTLIIDVPTGLGDPNDFGTWLIYPNPTSDALTIDFGQLSLFIGYSIQMVNSLGQIVYTGNVINQTEIVDVSTWASGTYLITVFNDTGTEVITKTLIIE